MYAPIYLIEHPEYPLDYPDKEIVPVTPTPSSPELPLPIPSGDLEKILKTPPKRKPDKIIN